MKRVETQSRVIDQQTARIAELERQVQILRDACKAAWSPWTIPEVQEAQLAAALAATEPEAKP
jgi:hypothetical protein